MIGRCRHQKRYFPKTLGSRFSIDIAVDPPTFRQVRIEQSLLSELKMGSPAPSRIRPPYPDYSEVVNVTPPSFPPWGV